MVKKRHVGYVYYANSKRIDASDKKVRRRYIVVKDNGRNVGVSKIRSKHANLSNARRILSLDRNKYPLKADESGVDERVYTTYSNSKEKLILSDYSVFDREADFKLSSKDTHKVLQHVRLRSGKKGKSNKT